MADFAALSSQEAIDYISSYQLYQYLYRPNTRDVYLSGKEFGGKYGIKQRHKT